LGSFWITQNNENTKTHFIRQKERVKEERVEERVEEICVFSPPSPPARRVLILLVGV
jgi:hypothetical protein